jgi:putative tryptophan/tyrosine transport system substrate-binding protein
MRCRHMIVGSLVLISLVTLMLVFSKRRATAITIGIIQTASHPALDAVKQGFLEELRIQLGVPFEVIEQNAQGSMNTAYAIAQSLHADSKVNIIVAIGTLAAQTVASIEKEKPIVFAAVTDPQVLGITAQPNVCGVSDRVDINKQVAELKRLMPSVRTVGILFNPAEANSVRAVEEMEQVLIREKLIPQLFSITDESTVSLVTTTACKHSDVLMVPTDNLVASTMPFIARISLQAHRGVIVGDQMLVEKGALASAGGIDYYNHGKDVAQYAISVLKGNARPHELPIGVSTGAKVLINEQVAQQLDVNIS